MITVFRIVHGLQGVPFGNLFLFHNTITKGNAYKLYKHFCHLNSRKFFSPRESLRIGTKLPTFVIESPDVLTFKIKLDRLWSSDRFYYI